MGWELGFLNAELAFYQYVLLALERTEYIRPDELDFLVKSNHELVEEQYGRAHWIEHSEVKYC